MKRKVQIAVVGVMTASINYLLIKYGDKVVDYTVIFTFLVAIEFVLGYVIRYRTFSYDKKRILGNGLYVGVVISLLGALAFITYIVVNWRESAYS